MPRTKSGIKYTAKPLSKPSTPYARSRQQMFARGPARPASARSGGVGVVRQLGSGQELKFKDLSKTDSAIITSSTGSSGEQNPSTVLCLNGVGQGDTMSSRIGTKINMKSIFVNGVVELPPTDAITAAASPPTVFIALVLDTQTNGGSATGLDSENVFSNPSANAVSMVAGLRNMSYSERYKVLKTKTIRMNPNFYTDGTDGCSPQIIAPFKLKAELKGMQTKFQTGTTTGYVGTIIDNSLHLIAYCSNAELAPLMTYNSRLRYTG